MTSERNILRRALRENFQRERDQLLPALHYLQSEFGYLSDWAMEVVGWHLGIPASEVFGAATSYTELRIEQPGRHTVRVCTGLSCWSNGAREVLTALESRFNMHAGSSVENGRFTLEITPCGFVCALAPAIECDGSWYGRISPNIAMSIIDQVVDS